MEEHKMIGRDCPFAQEQWTSVTNGWLYDCKCAIMEGKRCLLVDMYNDVAACKLIQRLLRAFQMEEYRVIQHMWHKIHNQKKWQNFVILYTDRTWRLWQTNLGKFLMEKCRTDLACPFKALLPENE